MKTYIISSITFLISLCSCSQNKDIKIERLSLIGETISKEIESQMPGQLLLTEDYILWTDPFNSDMYIHILDIQSGKELKKTLPVGNGPEEFLIPNVLTMPENKLFVHELNTQKKCVFPIDSILSQEEYLFQKEETNYKDIMYIIPLDKNSSLTFNPSIEQPFSLLNKDTYQNFGKSPFDGDINNRIDVFQGKIAYHPQKEVLVYSTFLFPYIAVYQKSGNTFQLINEKLSSNDCYVSENTFHYNPKINGAIELALTSDYIVTLERDRTIDQTDEETVGRDITKLPHTIFLYNYNLQLVKIIDLGMPIIRLASEPTTNTLYIIGIDDDYIIKKYEL